MHLSNSFVVFQASEWRPMKNTYGAVFEASILPNPPFSIRITNTAGQQVVAK
jgi:hypothetical protein